MVGKFFTRTLCCLSLLLLACSTMLAQSRPKQIRVNPSNAAIVPGALPPATATIYSNFGPTATNFYYSLNGWIVSGPTETLGFGEQWTAVPFTPSKNAHVTRMQVAVGYLGAGTNKFVLGLYNDAAGTVGTALKSVNVQNAPTFGTCCATITKNLPAPGVAVTAGTQYWIVASSSPTAQDFDGAWAFANIFTAFNGAEAGWVTDNIGDFGLGTPAVAVVGTIP